MGDGVPVDQALAAKDQAFFVEAHEDLAHGGAQALVHGEALAIPIAAGAEHLHLLDDAPAFFGFPLPNALEKSLAAQLMAGLAFFGQLAFEP